MKSKYENENAILVRGKGTAFALKQIESQKGNQILFFKLKTNPNDNDMVNIGCMAMGEALESLHGMQDGDQLEFVGELRLKEADYEGKPYCKRTIFIKKSKRLEPQNMGFSDFEQA